MKFVTMDLWQDNEIGGGEVGSLMVVVVGKQRWPMRVRGGAHASATLSVSTNLITYLRVLVTLM